MSDYSLLHISDLHMAVESRVLGGPDRKHRPGFPKGRSKRLASSSWDPDLFEILVARELAHQRRMLDAILVTGDLATTGEEWDLQEARKHIDRLTEIMADGSSRSDRRVLLVPGNHDRYKGIRKLAGGRLFDEVFSSYWPPQAVPDKSARRNVLASISHGLLNSPIDVIRKLRGIPNPPKPLMNPSSEPRALRAWRIGGVEVPPQDYRHAQSGLFIVAADLCLQRSRHARWRPAFSYLGQGKAYQAVCSRLQEKTKDIKKRFCTNAVVWAVHFPPRFPILDERLQLLDDHNLLNAAHEADVKHLFCGHTHVPMKYQVESVTVYCAGSSTQYCAPAPYINTIHPTTIRVQMADIVSVDWKTREWDDARKEYVEI